MIPEYFNDFIGDLILEESKKWKLPQENETYRNPQGVTFIGDQLIAEILFFSQHKKIYEEERTFNTYQLSQNLYIGPASGETQVSKEFHIEEILGSPGLITSSNKGSFLLDCIDEYSTDVLDKLNEFCKNKGLYELQNRNKEVEVRLALGFLNEDLYSKLINETPIEMKTHFTRCVYRIPSFSTLSFLYSPIFESLANSHSLRTADSLRKQLSRLTFKSLRELFDAFQFATVMVSSSDVLKPEHLPPYLANFFKEQS